MIGGGSEAGIAVGRFRHRRVPCFIGMSDVKDLGLYPGHDVGGMRTEGVIRNLWPNLALFKFGFRILHPRWRVPLGRYWPFLVARELRVL
jgi:hypothetical protein